MCSLDAAGAADELAYAEVTHVIYVYSSISVH